MTTDTCEPPEAHRKEPWHWLRLGDERPEPVRWRDEVQIWDRAGYWLDPIASQALGWRYVAPALPPEDAETGGGR